MSKFSSVDPDQPASGNSRCWVPRGGRRRDTRRTPASADLSAIKLHVARAAQRKQRKKKIPAPRRDATRRVALRRVAGYLLGSICEIRDLFVRERDGNRSWGAKVTRHNGDASISYPLLARTLSSEVALYSPSLTLPPFSSSADCVPFSFSFFLICVRIHHRKRNSLIASTAFSREFGPLNVCSFVFLFAREILDQK